MDWIHNYQVFLFDLDGLLVNTEELHFMAYKNMLKARGFDLPWDFNRYCQTAHYHSDRIRDELFELFPALREQEPSWDVLYSEKKNAMVKLLKSGAVHLMPGVEELLFALQKTNITSCVVTHSPDELVRIIREKNPLLNSISKWITRHDYNEPKPSSECYLRAISKYAKENDTVIGFEDTPRGLTALMGTRAKAVIICEAKYPEIPEFIKRGALHYPSFKAILQDDLKS